MQLQLANFVRGRLSAGITAAATSIPLTTAAFPALAQGAFCYAVLQSAADRSVVEIVKVTAGGATLTVERGQEGTTARDFAANDIIEQRLTAVQFQSVVDHSNAANSHVPAGVAGKFLKGVVDGAPVWGMPTASEVGALPISGGSLTGPLGVQTINGQGSSVAWGSLDVTGIKGGYAGINFPSAGHWFGMQPNGLSGVWKSDGTSKWYFNENGVLAGGAKILWDTIIDHPSRTNWASKAYVPVIVTGQLAWKNYGNGHTIFDASAGTSPDGTVIDKANSAIQWSSTYPTLMGWNGANTYGVRVDSARLADGAITADRITGIVSTNGQDLTIHGKRAMVGAGDSNQLIINYANDWGSTLIQGHIYLQTVESNRHIVVHNGSTVYSNSGLEVRTTDGSDARIGFHQAGTAAGAINFSSWGFQFEREAGRGSRANVAAANFFADAAQDTSGNALTRKDYVDGALSSKFDKTGGTISGDVVINTSHIRGANGAAIVKDHGNGNTTFSGSRNASLVAGDLYLGYHDSTNHFTNKVLLCKSMYSDANQNLQIIDYSNGALFDKGAAVIGANRDNVLNNPSFGVGFLSAHDAGTQWIAGYFGKNGGSNQVVVGEYQGGAVIGGHNAAKTAWAPIAINPGASGAETTYIGMYANQASGSGNLFVGNDVEANYMRLRSDIPNDSRYVVNRGYVDGNFIKRRTRLHPDDGTSLDNVQQEHGFNYSTGGGIFGPYISFGGLGGNYECQINADFISGNDIKFRTRNGDVNRWNQWNTIWNSANFDPNSKLNTAGGTVSGTVYNSVTGAPNTFVGGKISSEAGTLSLDAYSYAFVTSPNDVHLCHNSYYQPSTGWKKYDNNRPSGKIVISEGSGLQYLRSDAGSSDPNQYAYNIWHSGNFNPDSKLSENGHYGGTLKLNNWFRSVGASGWYNETYGGGIYQDEATTVKVYNGRKFSVANSENNSISSTGGVFSYRGMAVDTRTLVGNGNSYNYFRYNDAPFHAGFGGLNVGSFAPIVGSANYTNGYGYTTRVHFGVVTPGATGWTNAAIVVGSAENDGHPLASYQFGADGHITGSSKISTGYLFTERSDASVNLELKNNTNHPGFAFHKPGISWAVLRHDGGRYYMEGDGQNFTIGNDMVCSYAYANGAQPQVANALTRKDYVDSAISARNAASASKLDNARIFSIGGISRSFDGTGNVGWSASEIGSAVAAACNVESTNVPWVGSIALVARTIAAYGTAPTLNYGDTIAGSSLKVASVAGGAPNNATQACTGTWKVLSFFGGVSNGTSVATMQSGLAIRIA